MFNKKISIASDHNGYDLKQEIIKHLSSGTFGDYEVIDLGPENKERVDYPEYAAAVSESITDEIADIGILICGTGTGMAMAANRNSDIRAALCTSTTIAKFARKHNDANILVLGARMLESENAIKILEVFLTEKFDGGKHLSRLKKYS